MDWKHFRRSPLSGLVGLTILGLTLVAGAGGRADRIGSGEEGEIRGKTDALDSVRTEIDSRRKKIHELEKAEGSTLDRLRYLEANIAASRNYLLLLSQKIDSTGAAVRLIGDSLEKAGAELSDRRRLMGERLRRAYMAPRESPLMIFFMARSPAEAIQRTRYLEAVHAYDRALADKIGSEQRNFNAQKAQGEARRSELAELLAEKTGEKDQLVLEEAQRRVIIKEIRSKKKAYLAKIAELEVARKELDRVIKLLEQKHRYVAPRKHPLPGAPATAFEKLKGDLPWPVEGPVLARFGKIVHPVYKTVITNNGIDIGATSGQGVKCIADGSVLYTGSMRGLGRLVIVDHGNGYLTVYADLAQIAVSTGQKVEAGTIVGKAGEATEENGAQVHFEIRKSTDSLDPQQWLTRR